MIGLYFALVANAMAAGIFLPHTEPKIFIETFKCPKVERPKVKTKTAGMYLAGGYVTERIATIERGSMKIEYENGGTPEKVIRALLEYTMKDFKYDSCTGKWEVPK